MEYTILILLLPFLSFLLIGLLDSRLKPGAAGTFGTVVTLPYHDTMECRMAPVRR